jgi:hypothetical protein
MMKKKSRRERIFESRLVIMEDDDSMVIPIAVFTISFVVAIIYMFYPVMKGQ